MIARERARRQALDPGPAGRNDRLRQDGPRDSRDPAQGICQPRETAVLPSIKPTAPSIRS